MVPSNPIYKCSYDILASTICHCKHIPVELFYFMCLQVLTHIPQDVSNIIKGCHLLKYGESWKMVFSNFNVLGCAM